MTSPFSVSRPVFSTIAVNTTSQLIGKIIGSASVFFITVIIGRTFGSAGYGEFVKITTFVGYFYLGADFGINAVYLQKSRHETKDEGQLWGTLISLRFALGLLLVFLAVALLAFLPQGSSQGYTNLVRLGIIIYSPTILLQAILVSANGLFQKHLRYDLSTIASASGAVLSLVLVWLLSQAANAAAGVVFTVAALSIGATLTAGLSLVLVKRLIGAVSITVKVKSMMSLLVTSVPLGLTLIFNLVYFRIDSLIMALTRSTAEVGTYGLAYKLFEFFLVLPTFFMNAMYPLLLTSDNRKFLSLFRKSAIFLLLAALILAIGIWIFAPAITIINKDFVTSIPALRILSLSLPFFFLSSLLMWALIAKGKQKLLVVIYGISMVLNIFANSILIPRFGFVAAAWLTVIFEGLVLLSLVSIYWFHLKAGLRSGINETLETHKI